MKTRNRIVVCVPFAVLASGHGANVGARNHFGTSALTEAATTGSASVIDVLLKAGADPNSALDTTKLLAGTSSRTWTRPTTRSD